MDIIRNTENKKLKVYAIKIIDVIKNEINELKKFWEFIKTDTTAECTLPIDSYALENFVRCVWYDITEFFSKEENVINYRQQKPENADTAPLTEEDV